MKLVSEAFRLFSVIGLIELMLRSHERYFEDLKEEKLKCGCGNANERSS